MNTRPYAPDFDVKAQADRMLLLGQFLDGLDLDALTAVVEDAHTVGWFLDPTLYNEAVHRGDMDRMAKFAAKLKDAQSFYREEIASAERP